MLSFIVWSLFDGRYPGLTYPSQIVLIRLLLVAVTIRFNGLYFYFDFRVVDLLGIGNFVTDLLLIDIGKVRFRGLPE